MTTKAKKKTVKSKVTKAKKSSLAPGKAIIYLHAAKGTKTWLKSLAKKTERVEGGKVSISTMAERVFHKAQKLSEYRV